MRPWLWPLLLPLAAPQDLVPEAEAPPAPCDCPPPPVCPPPPACERAPAEREAVQRAMDAIRAAERELSPGPRP